MSQLNAKEAELKRRKHVISVMHEKAQLDIGKELLRLFFGPFFSYLVVAKCSLQIIDTLAKQVPHLRLCETYMEKRSRIAMATRKDGPEACLDAIIRQAASDHQAG